MSSFSDCSDKDEMIDIEFSTEAKKSGVDVILDLSSWAETEHIYQPT